MADLAQKQAAALQETLRAVSSNYNKVEYLLQIESELWTYYEVSLRQKLGDKAEKTIAEIRNNPDPLDRVLSLIEAIRGLTLSKDQNTDIGRREENVRQLEEERAQERLAREAEAERKLAQQGFDAHAAYQKHLALLKQVVVAAKETDPQIAAALEKSLPDIAPSLVLEPVGTIEKLAGILAPEILAPLIPEVSHPVIENVYLQTYQFIPQPAAAAAVTILKISTPETTVPQIQQLLDRLSLASEAIGKPLNISQTAAVSISQIQAPSPPAPPLILSLHNQFLKAGYPAPQAQTLAAQFASQFVPLINTVASFTPHQPSDSPQQHSQRVSRVQIYFSNQVIEYLGLRTDYFTSPIQYYASQPNFSPDSQLSKDQSGWFNYLIGFGKNKIQDKISSAAWEKFAASEIGKKVLTSLGTKAATTAATVGAETAAGAALAPETLGLSLLIPLAIEAVKNLWSKAKVIIKEYLPAIVLGLTGLIGGIVGGLGFMGASALGLTGIATGAAIQGSGGVGGALTKAGNAVTSASSALVGLVATEIATPIIIIGLSIPVAIALILFIINSSALVVPPNNLTASGSGIIGGGGTCTIPSSGFCSPSYLSPTFSSQTSNAAQICNRESIGGNPAALNDSCLDFCDSGGDTSMVTATTNPNVKIQKCTWINRHTGDYSAGLFQTNLLCSSHSEPSSSGSPKECYKAFAANYCGSLACPSVSDWTLLANCVAYFWNPDNSIAYSNNQSSCNDTNPDTRNWTPWTTAKSCGIQSNCAP